MQQPTTIQTLTLFLDKGETDYFLAKEANRRYPNAIDIDAVEKGHYEVKDLYWEDGQLTVMISNQE